LIPNAGTEAGCQARVPYGMQRASPLQGSYSQASRPLRRPRRGCAAVAPQNPQEAAKELERDVRKLGLRGATLNSQTLGEYLDDPKFWHLFAAAVALDLPLYVLR
jgi:Amidohydrolase